MSLFAQVGFRHHKDYQAYVWAKGEHATQACPALTPIHSLCSKAKFRLNVLPFLLHQVTFSEEDLPRDDCEYILGYYSNNMNSIVGLSAAIQVCAARDKWNKQIGTFSKVTGLPVHPAGAESSGPSVQIFQFIHQTTSF